MIVDAELKPGRQFTVPHGLRYAFPLTWPSRVLFAGNPQTRARVGFPVVIANLASRVAAITASGSPTGQRLNPFGPEVDHVIAGTAQRCVVGPDHNVHAGALGTTASAFGAVEANAAVVDGAIHATYRNQQYAAGALRHGHECR
jgi:hypothetical protein